MSDRARFGGFLECVDALDVQQTIEREREALLSRRSQEASLAREELYVVERDLADLRVLADRARQDYEGGALAPEFFSRARSGLPRPLRGA